MLMRMYNKDMKITPVKAVNNDWNPDVSKKLRGYQSLDSESAIMAKQEQEEGPATVVEISDQAKKLFNEQGEIKRSSTEGE